MRFVVKAAAARGNGKARAGVLHAGGSCLQPIETPALLLSTRKGLPAFVTPDLLSALPCPDSRLLHVSPLHFVECPSSRTISSIGGLRNMLGLYEHLFVAVARDDIDCLPVTEGTNKLGASFETPCGRLLVKPTKYVEMISSLKPNLWASLADEVPTWVPKKRNMTSVDRTVRWLDGCIALDPSGGESILGSIVGGSSLEERSRCAKEVAKRNVSGYWIGGFGLGECMEERPVLLAAVMDSVAEEKLRCISGLGLPEEVLQGVASGVDLFDSTYIHHLTLGGFALIFNLDTLDRIDKGISDSQPSNIGSDGTKINLRATIYRKDTAAIMHNCSCFTCQNHTRAYINHLLTVHEMLAQILLEIHNTHHYLGFFRLIRKAIKHGEFNLFHQKFIEGRHEHFVSTVPCS
uniref:Queuine tRNA-ribosyltransferase accessory subunit 2 n=1 Tax=Anthurium amnicola TaxID=1678845 RepID=A0A1D1Y9E3_9ARAE